MIDWVLAERLAARVAGRGDADSRATAAAQRDWAAQLPPIAADAEARIVTYTQLQPHHPLPPPESVDRREWLRANIASMRQVIDPVLERAEQRIAPRRPAPRFARTAPSVAALATSAAVTTEVGTVLGLLAQRVLGQYELVLIERTAEQPPPRLLFVAPNLRTAIGELHAPEDEFLTWVTLHEVTHAVQFAGIPWLRGHLAGLVAALSDSAGLRLESRHPRLPSRDRLADAARAARHGDVVGLFATPGERVLLDRAQATMAVVEGHAEHVMDAVAPELLPSLPRLRAALDRRRQSRTGMGRVLGRLLGLELKMSQYRQGKLFCDAIVASAGTAAFARLFASPEALPSLGELSDPARWVDRVGSSPR